MLKQDVPRRAYRVGVQSLLFIVLGASTVAPVTLFGMEQTRRWRASELEASDRQALAAAHSAGDQLSLAMVSYVRAAETFAAGLGGTPALEVERMKPLIVAHLAHHPEFIGAYVADAQGKSVLGRKDNGFFPTGVDYSDRDYYRAVVRTKQVAISGALVGRVTGVLTVQVAAPVFDAGDNLLGFTCSSVNLHGIAEQAKGSVRGMSHGRLVVVDGLGHRIADSAEDAVSRPEDVSTLPLFARASSDGGELRVRQDDLGQAVRGIVVNLQAPVSNWRVVAITPQWVIDDQAKRVRTETVGLALVLALAALAASAALAAWLARPLRALATTAAAVVRGELDSLPRMPTRMPREMALLADAVRTMLVELGSHARELELQVGKRTSELSTANTELSIALAAVRKHERERSADIDKARLFQVKLLPKLPEGPEFDIAVHYAPLAEVSGDIYDVVALPTGGVRIFLADATGHGVQASMRTLLLKSAYDRLKLGPLSPSQLLDALNRHLVAEFPDGDLHCTACCVDIEPQSRAATVRYSNAGGPPLYVRSPRAAMRELYAEGPLLGVDELTWPEPTRFELHSGELLIIASDGLSEQWNAARLRFDTRLLELSPVADTTARRTLDEILEQFRGFVASQPVRDDVTIVALGLREPGPVVDGSLSP